MIMQPLQPVTLADVLDLQRLGRQTFWETFADSNSPEDMSDYLQKAFATEKLSAELSNPLSFFYLLRSASEPVGYLKLNMGSAQTEPQAAQSLEIERIYLLKSAHGQGGGQLMLDKALEIAQAQGADYIWLGVWEQNHRALRFYQKNGFEPFDKHIFKLGDDEQTDIMMRRYL